MQSTISASFFMCESLPGLLNRESAGGLVRQRPNPD
jgi:hypothetical protein